MSGTGHMGFILASAWKWVGIAAGAVLLCAWFLFSDRRRVRRLREEHLQTHQELSEEEFLRQVEVPSERATVALQIRESIAGYMKVPVLTVCPSDTIEHILLFAMDGGDFVEIHMLLEEALKARISDDFWSPLFPKANPDKANPSLGDLVRLLVENWDAVEPR